MDRKAWIAIVFSILGLVAWQWYYVKTYSPKRPVASSTGVPAPTPVAIQLRVPWRNLPRCESSL